MVDVISMINTQLDQHPWLWRHGIRRTDDLKLPTEFLSPLLAPRHCNPEPLELHKSVPRFVRMDRTLLDLPVELQVSIFKLLADLDDARSLSYTCRVLRSVYTTCQKSIRRVIIVRTSSAPRMMFGWYNIDQLVRLRIWPLPFEPPPYLGRCCQSPPRIRG